jgi:hypothetical protein
VSLGRALAVAAAGAALAACVGVVLVDLVFALHALVKPYLGATGATALVIALAAVGVGLAAIVAPFALRPRRPKPGADAVTGLVERALVFVRDRPVVSIAGAVTLGFAVVANPRFVGALVRAFLGRRRASASQA